MVPLFGLWAEFEDSDAIVGADVEFTIFGVRFLDGRESNLEARFAAKENLGRFKERFAGVNLTIPPEPAGKFATHVAPTENYATAQREERTHPRYLEWRYFKKGLVSRSWPMVVLAPWPGWTIVESGSWRSLSLREATISS